MQIWNALLLLWLDGGKDPTNRNLSHIVSSIHTNDDRYLMAQIINTYIHSRLSEYHLPYFEGHSHGEDLDDHKQYHYSHCGSVHHYYEFLPSVMINRDCWKWMDQLNITEQLKETQWFSHTATQEYNISLYSSKWEGSIGMLCMSASFSAICFEIAGSRQPEELRDYEVNTENMTNSVSHLPFFHPSFRKLLN